MNVYPVENILRLKRLLEGMGLSQDPRIRTWCEEHASVCVRVETGSYLLMHKISGKTQGNLFNRLLLGKKSQMVVGQEGGKHFTLQPFILL